MTKNFVGEIGESSSFQREKFFTAVTVTFSQKIFVHELGATQKNFRELGTSPAFQRDAKNFYMRETTERAVKKFLPVNSKRRKIF